MRRVYERAPREVVAKEDRPMSKKKYEEMYSYEFDKWQALVIEAIKSCKDDKGPKIFVVSNVAKIREAELKLLACYPNIKFQIEREGYEKFN